MELNWIGRNVCIELNWTGINLFIWDWIKLVLYKINWKWIYIYELDENGENDLWIND